MAKRFFRAAARCHSAGEDGRRDVKVHRRVYSSRGEGSAAVARLVVRLPGSRRTAGFH